ncbi:hypothetical protein H8K35_10075 [Undibacterium sp. LX40W]|uniref:PilZ domain-containing protein n=1 Tax=Undibacterium nitidum TaxID=2762298 RepID=A0A923KLM3_9BURK|nr:MULTISPECIES: hypothetical protein [Undibacterium]MBC3882000.1 hypothetical protein [Undibacterium nitidum]MBC3892004.1 hypothetical protein [Undibacterium sp. LX40W]
MLKTLLSIAFKSDEKPHIVMDESSAIDQRFAWLRPVIELFPLGRKQRYYPGYKSDIVFDTMVIAYRVNGHFIYSMNAIDNNAEGDPAFFKIGANGERLHVSQLQNFELVVPDTSDLERHLDYERRAALGRGRQFEVGNTISLLSSQAGRGASVVDTVVNERIALDHGPYAHQNMICLMPNLETMSITDQRGKSRVKTDVPVLLAEPNGPWLGAWKIIDVSDQAIRVQLQGDAEEHHDAFVLPVHSEVSVMVQVAKTEQQFQLKGYVMRRFPKARVIRLSMILKDERYQNFGPFDLVELKAALLNH